jgi:HEAT repeat protein
MALRDLFRRPASGLGEQARMRLMRFGTPSQRVDVVRAWANDGASHHLLRALQDRSPAIRRAAARGLGWHGDEGHIDVLQDGFAKERTDTVRVALCGALIRCGVPWEVQFEALRSVSAETIETVRGPRCPGKVTHHGPKEQELELCYEIGRVKPGPSMTRAEVLEHIGPAEKLNVNSKQFAALLFPLASQQPPGFETWLLQVEKDAQRTARYAMITAMGFNGSPAFVKWLHGALTTNVVSPAVGFRQRTISAIALGAVGLKTSTPILLRGYETEKRDYEGTPGSGLGIQLPVRAFIVWALGELSDVRALPTLVLLLDNEEGNALSGFDLPAMGAISKMGLPALSDLRAVHSSNPIVKANVKVLIRVIGT